MEHDVLVIGGGLAGLQTARLLHRAGRKVQVLEARDRVGGRTLSTQIDDAVFDLGGQWLGRGQLRLQKLAQELGIATYPQYTQGKRILVADGKVRTYAGTIPRLAPWKLIEIQLAMMRLARLTRRVAPHAPMADAHAAELDSVSLAHMAQRWLYSRTSRNLLAAAVRVVFGAEMSDISLLYALSYFHAGGGFEALIEAEKGAQAARFVGGAQALSLAIASELSGRVQTSAPVRSLRQDARGVSVATDRGTYRAHRAVLAIPPPLWSRIDFSPLLPVLHEQLSQRAPMGATVKAIATYDRPFWREAGLSGEAVFDQGPVSVTFDATTSDGSRPALLAFVVGQQARTWSSRGSSERQTAVLAALGRCFGPQAREPRKYHEQDWSTEAWTRGCPVSVLGTGVLSSCAPALRAPFGCIHLAGTETAREHTGYLEGALESAERAFTEVCAALS